METVRDHPVNIRLKIAFGVVVGYVVLALFFCLVEKELSRRHLQQVRRSLESDGLLRPLVSIVPIASEEQIENGRRFLEVIEPLGQMKEKYPAIQNGPEVMKLVSPGNATSGLRGVAPLFYDQPTEGADNWEEFRNQLNAGSEILASAAEWLKNPMALDEGVVDAFSPAGQTLQLSAWFRASAVMRLRDGDVSGTLDDFEQLQELIDLDERVCSPVSHTLSNGVWIYSIFGIAWEILQSDKTRDEDLVRLNKIVSKRNFIEKGLLAMEFEMTRLPKVWSAFYTEGWDHAAAPSGVFGWGPVIRLRNLLYPSIWKDRDLSGALAKSAEEIRIGRAMLRDRNWQKRSSSTPLANSPYDQWRFPFQEGQLKIVTVENLLFHSVKCEANRQLLLAAIALERYRLKNGVYPETFEMLTPGFVSELPHDWFSGHPLRYRRLAPDRFHLYSVNKDGVDDGGDPKPLKAKREPNMHSGRDLVWPHLKK